MDAVLMHKEIPVADISGIEGEIYRSDDMIGT